MDVPYLKMKNSGIVFVRGLEF